MNERHDPFQSEDVRSAAERLIAVLDEVTPTIHERDSVEWWIDVLQTALGPRELAVVRVEAEALAATPRIIRELLALLASLVRGEGHEEHHANCEVTVATCTCQQEKDLSRMDSSTRLVEQRATASTVTPSATNGTKEPGYFPFAIERKDPADTCGGCGGPYAWDTTIQSEVWNRVVRPLGISEYLCTNCILRLFAARGEGFTAELWGGGRSGVDFNGLFLRVRFSDTADGNQQSSGLRGDPVAPRTVTDDTRDKESSSSPAITQALITALKGLADELERRGLTYPSSDFRIAADEIRAALAFAEKG